MTLILRKGLPSCGLRGSFRSSIMHAVHLTHVEILNIYKRRFLILATGPVG